MPQFDKNADPLGFLEFMSNSFSVRVTVPTDDWQATLSAIDDRLEGLECQYIAMLGNEDNLTDDAAEIVIYVGSADGLKLAQEALIAEMPEEPESEPVQVIEDPILEPIDGDALMEMDPIDDDTPLDDSND